MLNVEFMSGNSEYVRGVLNEPSTTGPHPVIVFVHGLLSTHDEFGDYPLRFAERGYLTLAIDLRGHGKSDGPRGFLTEERMLDDIQHSLDLIQNRPSARSDRIVLFGHSLGGGACLCAAARDARVGAVVAGATVGRLKDEVGAAEMFTYRIADMVNRAQKLLTGKSLYLPYRVGYKDIFAEPSAAAQAEAKGFLQRKVPIDNIAFLLAQDAITCARQVRVPVLLVASELDRVVKPSSQRKVYDALSCEKEWYVIQGSGHSFATDCQKEVAFSRISEWIDRHL